MPTEERLELVSTVEDGFSEPLKRLEASLEAVDDEIRQTGRGRDHVRIDVEANTADVVTELAALEAGIEALDDDLTIDVDSDFDDVLREDVRVNRAGRGSQFIESDTGQFTSARDSLRREFSDISDAIGEEMDAGSVDIDTGHVDVNAATATGGRTGVAVTSGGRRLNDPSVLLPPRVSRGGLNTPSAASSNRQRDLLGWLDGDTRDRGMISRGLHRFRRSAGNLGDELRELNFTMGAFHQVIASLIPLLGVFIGALPAAITGVVALGTAALAATAALAGIGVLGAAGLSLQESGEVSMDPIMERLGQVSDTFVEAFSPLAREFAPTIQYAIDQIEAMAGPLATASEGLLQLRGAFEGAIGFITGSLPSMVADFTAFATAAMPILSGFVQFFSDVDWLGAFASELARAWPFLVMFGNAIVDMLPAIMSLSQGFLVVAGVVTMVTGQMLSLINTFPFAAKMVGVLIGAFLTLVSVMTLHRVLITGTTGAVLNMARAFGTRVVQSIATWINAQTALNLTLRQTAVLLGSIMGILTFGLGPMISELISGFKLFGNNVAGARNELRRFSATNPSLRGEFTGTGTGTGSTTDNGDIYRDHSTTVIEAGNRDDAARQQYSSEYEQRQHVDAVFGG